VLGRENFAFPVRWDDEGWPEFGERGRLPERSITAGVDTHFVDDFSKKEWPFSWNFLRNPEADHYHREEGRLLLDGSADQLSGEGAPTWLGVRQRDHRSRCRADVEFRFDGEGDAGLTLFQNRDYHVCFGVKQGGDGRKGFVRIRLGELVWLDEFPPPPQRLALEIRSHDAKYELGWRWSENEWQFLRSVDARILSREFGGRFTGVYYALYAEGAARLKCTRFAYEPASGR